MANVFELDRGINKEKESVRPGDPQPLKTDEERATVVSNFVNKGMVKISKPSADANIEHRIKEVQWEEAQRRGVFKGVWLAKLLYPAEMMDIEKQVRSGSS